MGSSLGDLLAKAGLKATERVEPEPASAPAAPEVLAFGPKVVVRMTRKGRGGKTVSTVSGIVSGLEAALAKLKVELGVGGRIEGLELVLQGDQVERVARWLESQGAAKVIRG
jgi:translation initiation factor 1